MRPEEKSFDYQIIAIRPTNPDQYPPDMAGVIRQANDVLPPFDPGWLDIDCQLCGRDGRMGPRQRTQYELAPDEHIVLCMICAAITTSGQNIINLGGR